MSDLDLWERRPIIAVDHLAEINERLARIERMLGAGRVRTVTQTQIHYQGMVAQALEDGCSTIKEVCRQLQIARQRVSDALAALEAEGKVTRTYRNAPGRGRPHAVFTLREFAPSTGERK